VVMTHLDDIIKKLKKMSYNNITISLINLCNTINVTISEANKANSRLLNMDMFYINPVDYHTIDEFQSVLQDFIKNSLTDSSSTTKYNRNIKAAKNIIYNEYTDPNLSLADYSKKVSLKMATTQEIDGYDYTAGDGFAKFYSDKFNYDIKVTAIAINNWDERLRIWINSSDMPDICVYDYKHPDAAGFVEQKLLKKLPEGWKTRWANLAKVFDKTSLGPQMERRFNGTYFLPRARFVNNLPGDPLPDHFSFYMRKDWAQAVGFPVRSTYTTSEILQFGRLIQEKDPGKLGNKLIPITESTVSAVMLFVKSNSTHYNSFYKDKDGRYKWGAASEDTLKGLKLFEEAYTSKVLNQQFYTVKTNQELEHFLFSGCSRRMLCSGCDVIFMLHL
jgi:putative aldouronate transport system substrate-binding protein